MFGLFVSKHALAAGRHHQISVLYVQGISCEKLVVERKCSEENAIKTHAYFYKNTSCRFWNQIKFWYYLFIGYRSIVRLSGKPNKTHVHILTRLGLFALFLKLSTNIPYIISEHWSRYLNPPGTYKGWFRKKLTKIVVKHAQAILPISHNLAEAMHNHQLYNRNYQIIPNVVGDLFFESYESKKTDKTIFIHVSTFEDRSKNISGILRTIKKLSEKTKNFEFQFIGDGIDFQQINQYANELSIPSELIAFKGLQAEEALVALYCKADFLVVFSYFENIPVVLNEALACGLPVIATNVGGIGELVNKENGFLIEAGNENQLLNLLLRVIVENPQFDYEKIRKAASDQFSVSEIGHRLDLIYRAN
jgi:glycosyltransferase involved in cell wall biosynthesis